MTSSWFFLSTLNYDARSTTHQIVDYIIRSKGKIDTITGRRRDRTWRPPSLRIGGSFSGLKWPGHGIDHPLPYSTEGENE